MIALGPEFSDVEPADLVIEQDAKRRMEGLLRGASGKHDAAGPETKDERG